MVAAQCTELLVQVQRKETRKFRPNNHSLHILMTSSAGLPSYLANLCSERKLLLHLLLEDLRYL
jgi:hypothetical protein